MMAIPSKEREESNQDSEVVVDPENRSFIQNGATVDVAAADNIAVPKPECHERLVAERSDGENREPAALNGLNGISQRIFPYGFVKSTLVSRLE